MLENKYNSAVAPPESQPQNNNNNIDSQVFTRFDFSRMFTNRSPEIKIRYKCKLHFFFSFLSDILIQYLLILSHSYCEDDMENNRTAGSLPCVPLASLSPVHSTAYFEGPVLFYNICSPLWS